MAGRGIHIEKFKFARSGVMGVIGVIGVIGVVDSKKTFFPMGHMWSRGGKQGSARQGGQGEK